MALQIEYESDTGDVYPEAYGRIASVTMDYAEQSASVRVLLYRDHQARLLGKRPVALPFVFVIAEAPTGEFTKYLTGSDDLRAVLYRLLKREPLFLAAKDV